MSELIENLSDAELLAIIRKAENIDVPGSRYQKANSEWQTRNQKKLIKARENGRGGVFFEVGGDMVNDGVIQTGIGSRVGVAVAGNYYMGKKGKIIQTKSIRLKNGMRSPLEFYFLQLYLG